MAEMERHRNYPTAMPPWRTKHARRARMQWFKSLVNKPRFGNSGYLDFSRDVYLISKDIVSQAIVTEAKAAIDENRSINR